MHSSFLDTVKKLSQIKYDLVFNLHCNSLSHLLLFFIKYKKTVNISANWKQRLFGIKIAGKQLEETISSSGIQSNKVQEYFEQKDAKMVVLPFNQSQKIFSSQKKIVAISTGSSIKWISKKWGVNNYLQLIKMLQENNIDVILIGTHLELDDSKYILEQNTNITSFVDKTTLSELKNLLGSVSVYVGNDSGPSHISAALGTNTVTIFGSTAIEHCPKYGKYYGIHKCIAPSIEIKCHPCYKPVCPTNMECMSDIEVSKVYNEVMKVLN